MNKPSFGIVFRGLKDTIARPFLHGDNFTTIPNFKPIIYDGIWKDELLIF